MIRESLKTASEYYRFSDMKKTAAPLLYRCLKPLWYTRVEDMKALGNDHNAVKALLDEIEYYLTQSLISVNT